jgi:hypothetical protein
MSNPLCQGDFFKKLLTIGEKRRSPKTSPIKTFSVKVIMVRDMDAEGGFAE